MSAYAEAERLVGRRVLREYIAECLERGYVYVAPDCVLLGFRVGAGWFVRLAVGKGALGRFVAQMPYRLEFIGWAREFRGRKNVVWHPTEVVLRKVEQYEKLRIRREKELVLEVEGA